MTHSKERSYLRLFWVLALIGFLADQISKYAIFGALYHAGQGGEWDLLPGTFKIEAHYFPFFIPEDHPFFQLLTISGDHFPHVNRGALWGMGQGNSFAFAIVSFVASLVVIYWAYRPGSSRDLVLSCSLGSILAGTLGNLYDRIIFDGVRDFMHWYRWIDWAVFNVADVCLVCGAGLLLLHAFLVKDAPESTPLPADQTKQADMNPTTLHEGAVGS